MGRPHKCEDAIALSLSSAYNRTARKGAPMAAQQCKLRGRIERGMFPNEVAFVVTDHEGKSYVVLLPRESVEDLLGTPMIRVRVVDERHDLALVRLPGEPLDSSTVSVRTDQLVPA